MKQTAEETNTLRIMTSLNSLVPLRHEKSPHCSCCITGQIHTAFRTVLHTQADRDPWRCPNQVLITTNSTERIKANVKLLPRCFFCVFLTHRNWGCTSFQHWEKSAFGKGPQILHDLAGTAEECTGGVHLPSTSLHPGNHLSVAASQFHSFGINRTDTQHFSVITTDWDKLWAINVFCLTGHYFFLHVLKSMWLSSSLLPHYSWSEKSNQVTNELCMRIWPDISCYEPSSEVCWISYLRSVVRCCTCWNLAHWSGLPDKT